MIRILHSVSNMDRAGIETMLMNYYRHIDRSEIQFDFLVNKQKPGDYDAEIQSMGGRIFRSPGLSPLKYPAYCRFMKELLGREKDIRVVHVHNEGMGLYALRGAQLAGVRPRIMHAHNTRIDFDYKWPLKTFCKAFLPVCATDYWGCGREAGIFYFGEKAWTERGVLLHNAIDLDRFSYNSEHRAALRAEHGLSDRLVLGHVGRFSPQKNHQRLLEIFAAVHEAEPRAVLLLIGEGSGMAAAKAKAEALGIADDVRFLGLRSDVHDWYQVMDIFVMPSLFEGLPVVGIEAQALGVPCVYSSAVTEEAVILDASCRVSLKEPNRVWAERICAVSKTAVPRESCTEILRDQGYDIREEAEKLQNIYLRMIQ